MDNFKISQKVSNAQEVSNNTYAETLKLDKQNFYNKELHYIGGERHKTVFLQCGKIIIAVNLELRKTHSFDSENLYRVHRNGYGILEAIFSGKDKIEKTRKVYFVCCDQAADQREEQRRWISLENFKFEENTGVAMLLEYKEGLPAASDLEPDHASPIDKSLLLAIAFNDNDRKNREEKFYNLLGS